MATFLLDTGVIIDAINGKRDRGQFLKGLLEQGHLLACCPINVTEVYAGLRPKEEAVTQELLESLAYTPSRGALPVWLVCSSVTTPVKALLWPRPM